MSSDGLVNWKRDLPEPNTPPELVASTLRAIPESPVHKSVRLLHKHLWTIVACLTIIPATVLLYEARQPRLYRATAKIAIYRDSNSNLSLSKDSVAESSDLDDYNVSLETQLRILQSRSLALTVIRKLGLTENAQFLAALKASGDFPDQNNSPTATNIESAAVDSVISRLSVVPVKQTRVVEVSFTGSDPELDAKIANALVDVFIEDSIRSRYEASTRAATFLSGQLVDLRTKVEESQQKLVEYERAHNIVGVDEKQNVVTAKLEDLNKQLTAAEDDRIQKESLFQTIAAGSLDQIPESKASEALQTLRLREAELKNEFAQTNTTYGPNHPKVLELTNRIKAIDASIEAEQKRLAGRAQEEYQASVRREQKLRAAFEAQKVEANRLNESAIQYGLLKRDVDSNRQLYDNLQERLKEAGVAAGLRSSNIRLIDAAEAPLLPASPNLPKSAYIGLFVGFLASAAAIGIREGMDRALRDPADVELFTSMSSLAVIPKRHSRPRLLPARQHVDADDVVCLSQPRSATAEAYRALGTSIMLASPDLKTLLVTSPLPGEGKTTSAVNSAIVIAQQDKRVLLVDADLRKPTLHCGLGIPNEPGLSNILAGEAQPEYVILRHERVPNLSVLTAGPAQSMAAELLGSAKMRDLMSAWREQYDYVIIDTPPILAVTDAVRLSSQADSVLLIVRSGETKPEALARACDVLNRARVPVLGIVVNGVDFRSGSYYYGYYPELARKYYHDDLRKS